MQTVRLPQSELEKALAGRPKHIFLSGASRGIGEAIARLMGEEKHNFTLASRSYNRLLGLAMDLGVERAQAVKLDLAEEKSIDDAVVAAESKFGPIDVLILNAGINLPTPLGDLSAEGRARRLLARRRPAHRLPARRAAPHRSERPLSSRAGPDPRAPAPCRGRGPTGAFPVSGARRCSRAGSTAASR